MALHLTTIVEGGLASGGGTSGGDNSTNTGGSQPSEFAHGKVDPVEAGKSNSPPALVTCHTS